MYGAILGDIIGSPYEHDQDSKTKDFKLFRRRSRFTDDSVMTIAVADAILRAKATDALGDEAQMKELFTDAIKMWGRRYPKAGYGGRFTSWLQQDDLEPYYSFGNGSAMRVSPAAWAAENLEQTRTLARWSAEVTHNHPEGIKGAEAIASAVFLARTGRGREDIRAYTAREFGYDMNRTCDGIRPDYHFDVTCQGSVPEAIIAFLDGDGFEDVIRTAVSLGGDTDTLAAMAGSIAEAYYGVPEELKAECERRLPGDMREVLTAFMADMT